MQLEQIMGLMSVNVEKDSRGKTTSADIWRIIDPKAPDIPALIAGAIEETRPLNAKIISHSIFETIIILKMWIRRLDPGTNIGTVSTKIALSIAMRVSIH